MTNRLLDKRLYKQSKVTKTMTRVPTSTPSSPYSLPSPTFDLTVVFLCHRLLDKRQLKRCYNYKDKSPNANKNKRPNAKQITKCTEVPKESGQFQTYQYRR